LTRRHLTFPQTDKVERLLYSYSTHVASGDGGVSTGRPLPDLSGHSSGSDRAVDPQVSVDDFDVGAVEFVRRIVPEQLPLDAFLSTIL
jgi:hypothetical protein